jgi:hypothetical protein
MQASIPPSPLGEGYYDLTKTDKRIGGEGELTIVQKGYLQREAGIELGLLMSEQFDVNKAGEDGLIT